MDKQTNDIVKRIQSRVKAATGADRSIPMDICRKAYLDIVSNPPSPTEEEIRQVTQALINGVIVEVQPETSSIEPITSSPEPTVTPEESAAAFQLAQPKEESEAIALPETEEGQSEGTLSPSVQGEAQDFSVPETSTTGIVPRESGQLQQPSVVGGITQSQVTQAINQAAHQVGVQGDAEAIQALTSLATILSVNNRNTQDMVAALVSAYLNERQRILSSAIGTLNTLRTAQTESFQAGLDSDFFQQRERNKQEFLSKVGAMFN